ncbi:THO complex subunit 1 transcription elongation factor-domain-containing protein [Schizophyllum amplum]|uniref:THO complex subunit 1 transcription elongation factor-domain-containing protein n=1 Tax=Schizophyllum amplum TaxID=97359 RepID=A0A550CA06_9AGAR|nr:THO complex subunit 1 transcription elongation factor-domain-containing protein [Auriculariopsis ampla]
MVRRAHLDQLLDALPSPVTQDDIRSAVQQMLDSTRGEGTSENRKGRWEYLLKQDCLKLAATEAQALKDPETDYYERLQLRLDIALAFFELDAWEHSSFYGIIYDVLETHTAASCSVVFDWLQARASRVLSGITPKNGLVLLRMLNALLKRLSKTGATEFCGRIMTYLSSAFPMSDKSGVNLRGEYGPVWEGVLEPPVQEEAVAEAKEEKEDEDVKMEDTDHQKQSEPERKEDNAMQVDADASKSAQLSKEKTDLYQTFWSLQLPFSRPPLFGTGPEMMTKFRESVNKILPVIKEATAKERAMMGSRSGASSAKRKREPEISADANSAEYFFAKYLTSPDLLDLEIADTQFRRQFLLQLLVLLHHLLTFTPTAKAAIAAMQAEVKHRSLQMDFTLESDNERWVIETYRKAMEELRQTTPNGRIFADTVAVILEREKNWVTWKAIMCPPFDKEPWFEEVNTLSGEKRRITSLREATKRARSSLHQKPPPWKHSHGSASLTEVWEFGYEGIEDLAKGRLDDEPAETKPEEELESWVRRAQLEQRRIDTRLRQLEQMRRRQQPKPAPPPPTEPSEAITADAVDEPAKPEIKPDAEPPKPAPPPPPINDHVITQSEQAKERWNWLGLRAVRTSLYCSFAGVQAAPCKNEVEDWQNYIRSQREKAKALGRDEDARTASPAPVAASAPVGGSDTVPVPVAPEVTKMEVDA